MFIKSHHKFSLSLVVSGALLCYTDAYAQSQSNSEEPPTRPRIEKDRGQTIKLQSTITADKEQPAISYFVPWKGTGAPDKLNWNIESKHDDTLDIVDRDVLLRSMNIYNEMDLESVPAAQ